MLVAETVVTLNVALLETVRFVNVAEAADRVPETFTLVTSKLAVPALIVVKEPVAALIVPVNDAFVPLNVVALTFAALMVPVRLMLVPL